MTRLLRLAQKIYADTTALSVYDVMSKEDYETERAQLLRLATQHRSQRRLRLSPSLSLIFENRFTAWLQIQEELRWLTRPSDEDLVEVLTRCNLVVPAPDQLKATLFVDGGDNPESFYWMECIAANAFSVVLHLSGTVLRARSHESSGGELATVHNFTFQPTARCGPNTEIIWGDTTLQHTTPVSAATRHALAQDLNPAGNRNCFIAPTAARGAPTGVTDTPAHFGAPKSALPKYPPLRLAMAPRPEAGADKP